MSNAATTVAYIDQEFILGPEGAHINMSGISGLATKTSFAMFMLQSILQKAEKTKDEGGVSLSDKIAVVILNVKQGDLLQIDQRPDKNPSVEQNEMWEAMGMEARPFKNVRYLLPRSNQPGTPNSFIEPASGYQSSLRVAARRTNSIFCYQIFQTSQVRWMRWSATSCTAY